HDLQSHRADQGTRHDRSLRRGHLEPRARDRRGGSRPYLRRRADAFGTGGSLQHGHRPQVTGPSHPLSLDSIRTPLSTPVTWTPMLAAVAVLRAIRALTTLNVRLKWPNDVLAIRNGVGRKLAGILVDAIGTGQGSRRAMVVGIGINVNMPAAAFPEELRATASSLLIETGSSVDRGQLLAALLDELERLYDHACTHGPGDITAAYQVACDTLGN